MRSPGSCNIPALAVHSPAATRSASALYSLGYTTLNPQHPAGPSSYSTQTPSSSSSQPSMAVLPHLSASTTSPRDAQDSTPAYFSERPSRSGMAAATSPAHGPTYDVTYREVHKGYLSYLSAVPCLGSFFTSMRCCACHDGVGFVPGTHLQTNTCIPYERFAVINDSRAIGREAITAEGVKITWSDHALEKIRAMAAQQDGKVFKVTFTKFNPIECFCACGVCCACCAPVVVEDMVVINKVWYGWKPQEPCLPCNTCTHALLCCRPCFGWCEPSVNMNIADVAYSGAPVRQYMG